MSRNEGPNAVWEALLAAARRDGIEPKEPSVAVLSPEEPPPAATSEGHSSPPYLVLTKAGALKNGAERGHGSVWHAVVPGKGALCGERPRIMWSSWSPAHAEVTCVRCQKAVAKLTPLV
jgi:hypothetical protein